MGLWLCWMSLLLLRELLRLGEHSRGGEAVLVLLCEFDMPIIADDSGPTVERGLTALDALYELRNVIPNLDESSTLQGLDGMSPKRPR
jgi:hypothetical protein